jgi:hypothetical protein
MASSPIEIPIKLNGLAAIKSELRELKGELANATDPKQMQELAMRAGELKDQLADANEQVAVFASGSKFEQVSNSFGSMKDSLMSLDFEEAAQKAKMFQQTLGSISPATIGNSIKGLISVVGSLSKAFVQFGVALLANPIFLLVAAIVAIVAVIGVIMNKLGILKPVLNAIGKAFEFIGAVVDMVIQGFKDLTDWLGLTNNAAEDAADKQAAAAEKTAAAYEEKSKSVVGGYDREIELAKLDGKNTVELEKQKQYWIIKTAEARLKAIKEKIIAGKLSGDLDSEEIAELRKAYNEQVEVVKDSKHQVEVIDKTEANRKKEDREKEAEEQAKTTENNRKKAADSYKARIEAEKKYQAERLAARRQIEDLEASLLEEGVQKELQINKLKFKRLIEDTQARVTKTKEEEDEKARLLNLYYVEYSKTQDEINQKELARINQFEIDAKKIKEDAETAWLQTVEDIAEQNYINSLSDKDKELLAVNDKYFALQEAAKGNAEQMKIIEEAKATEVAAINDKAAKDEIASLQAVADAKKAIQNANLDLVVSGVGLLKNVFEKNKSIQKGLLIAENAAGIAKIIINTAAANAAVTLKYALIPGGPAIAAGEIARNKIGAGIGIAASIAATAKGLAALGGGGATGGTAPGGGGGGSSSTSTQQATPQVNLFGANNNANTINGSQSSNQGGEMIVKAVVVESDVTSMQKKMNKVQESAVL